MAPAIFPFFKSKRISVTDILYGVKLTQCVQCHSLSAHFHGLEILSSEIVPRFICDEKTKF